MTDDNDADPLKAGQQECESKVPCEGESEGGRRQTAEMTNRNRLEDLWRQISFQTKQSSMFSEFLTGSDICTEEMRCLETSPCPVDQLLASHRRVTRVNRDLSKLTGFPVSALRIRMKES